MCCVSGWIAVAVLAGGWAGADEPTTESRGTTMVVPDRSRPLIAGDRAEIYGGEAPGCRSLYDYHQIMKAITAKDDVGIREVYEGRLADRIGNRTAVLVIQDYRTPAYRKQDDEYSAALEVRVLDGPIKDQVRFVPETMVARMRTFLKPPPEPKVEPKTIDPETRAASILKMAEGLEKAKKVPGALTLYRQVAKDYPRTKAAGKASERIKALTAAAKP